VIPFVTLRSYARFPVLFEPFRRTQKRLRMAYFCYLFDVSSARIAAMASTYGGHAAGTLCGDALCMYVPISYKQSLSCGMHVMAML